MSIFLHQFQAKTPFLKAARGASAANLGHLGAILGHLGAKVGSGRVLPYCLQTLGPTSDPKLQTELVLHKIWGAAACPPQAFSIRLGGKPLEKIKTLRYDP